MRKIRIEMTGQRFGRLYALAFSHLSPCGHAMWLFRCDCGKETIANGSNVRRGVTQSCGCLHRECSAMRLITHGHRAAGRHGPSYRAWQTMNDICSNPASPNYPRFGGLGITVCAEWKADYSRFLAEMGERPHGTVLSRIKPDGGFVAGNCQWIARKNRSERAVIGWKRRRTNPTSSANEGMC